MKKAILIILFALLGFFGWFLLTKEQRNSQRNLNITPTPTIILTETSCSQDSDCIIGIQATSCCSCPKTINKKLVETGDWERYEFGKDYSSQQSKSCEGTVACEPCELPREPVCLNNQCH